LSQLEDLLQRTANRPAVAGTALPGGIVSLEVVDVRYV
jgi:hypothetical protein